MPKEKDSFKLSQSRYDILYAMTQMFSIEELEDKIMTVCEDKYVPFNVKRFHFSAQRLKKGGISEKNIVKILVNMCNSENAAGFGDSGKMQDQKKLYDSHFDQVMKEINSFGIGYESEKERAYQYKNARVARNKNARVAPTDDRLSQFTIMDDGATLSKKTDEIIASIPNKNRDTRSKSIPNKNRSTGSKNRSTEPGY